MPFIFSPYKHTKMSIEEQILKKAVDIINQKGSVKPSEVAKELKIQTKIVATFLARHHSKGNFVAEHIVQTESVYFKKEIF